MKMGLNPWWGLVFFVAVSFAAAALGGLSTANSVGTWYTTLRKPAWTPPSAVFGPVWTVLYLLMGIAAWLVWRRQGGAGATVPLTLFFVQLLFNAAWSWLFFGLRNPGLACGDIVLLWMAILATLISFGRVTPLAAWLMTPYLLWVTFAAMLNFAIWRMNT